MWAELDQLYSMTHAHPPLSMTFDEVGAPARLSGGLSPGTNIPVVHTLLMEYSQLLI